MGRLRYKSTRFRMCHRNVPALAALHAKVVTESAINQYENFNYISDDEDKDNDDVDVDSPTLYGTSISHITYQ